MLKKILLVILCSLIGLVFIFSGYSKLYPIEPFEYTLVDLGFVNWHIAPFAARLLIGLEFLIGFALLINYSFKNKWVYKIGILTLLIFSFYLIVLIIYKGNVGDCGCFGTKFQMTPIEGLVKNVIMLGAFLILYKFYDGWTLDRKFNYEVLFSISVILALPFILNSVELDYSREYLNKKSDNIKIPMDSLYKNATINTPPQSLSKGKHILVFLSLKCKHCRIAAKKLKIMKERNPQIPIYFVLNGDTQNLKEFFEDTGSENIPYCMLVGRSFVFLAGLELPTIYLINNSVIEHRVNYLDLDQYELEKWLVKK